MIDNELITILNQLAKLNYYGAPFLISYGVTWSICGFLWKNLSNKFAAYATLFQGLVALPFALGVSYFIGSFNARPGGEIISQLSVLISMSQLLVLPILIVFHIRKQYTILPFIFSISSSIHFIFYSWLYQTYFYIIMSVVIAFGSSILYYLSVKEGESFPTKNSASKLCFLTSFSLFITALGLLFLK